MKQHLMNLLQSDDLLRIEDQLGSVNIFELVGMRNQEIKHSNFLKELLDPNSSLNIGDAILKRFIRKTLKKVSKEDLLNNLDPIDFELTDTSNIVVYREYRDIDLLIVNTAKSNPYCIAIENKTGSQESPHQLQKYRKILKEDYPNYKKLHIFLTPDGRKPKGDHNWIPTDFTQIVSGINYIIDSFSLSDEVNILLSHYKSLLEKFVTNDLGELEELANKIYLKHRRALDFIFDKRFDFISALSISLQNCIKELSKEMLVFPIVHNKGYTRFVTQQMKDISSLIKGNGWKTDELILFELASSKTATYLKLVLGSSEDTKGRSELLEHLKKSFKSSAKGTSYATIYSVKLASYNFDEDININIEDLAFEICSKAKEKLPQLIDQINTAIDQFINLRK